MSSRFVKILKISQSHLAPGMDRERLGRVLRARDVVKPIDWERVTDQELDQMVQEILAVITAHRTGVL